MAILGVHGSETWDLAWIVTNISGREDGLAGFRLFLNDPHSDRHPKGQDAILKGQLQFRSNPCHHRPGLTYLRWVYILCGYLLAYMEQSDGIPFYRPSQVKPNLNFIIRNSLFDVRFSAFRSADHPHRPVLRQLKDLVADPANEKLLDPESPGARPRWCRSLPVPLPPE